MVQRSLLTNYYGILFDNKTILYLNMYSFEARRLPVRRLRYVVAAGITSLLVVDTAGAYALRPEPVVSPISQLDPQAMQLSKNGQRHIALSGLFEEDDHKVPFTLHGMATCTEHGAVYNYQTLLGDKLYLSSRTIHADSKLAGRLACLRAVNPLDFGDIKVGLEASLDAIAYGDQDAVGKVSDPALLQKQLIDDARTGNAEPFTN